MPKTANKTRSKTADITELLKKDHLKVKDLFKQFEKSEDHDEKAEIVRQAIVELKVHKALEEEIVYPAVREVAEDDELMDEAAEEHHVADLLIAELEDMEPDDERYDAKFCVLSELVLHHIEEEETEMFPKAKKIEDREELVQRFQQRKEELMSEEEGPRAAEPAGREQDEEDDAQE